MAKMIFNKEEIKNIIMMLQSKDADNHVIAFESLKNVDFNKNIGELIVAYKYAGHDKNSWQKSCEPVYKKLAKIIPDTLTSPKTLSLISEHKGSNEAVELFMEFFVKDMTNVLLSIGYLPENFEINVKLKNNG